MQLGVSNNINAFLKMAEIFVFNFTLLLSYEKGLMLILIKTKGQYWCINPCSPTCGNC